jgi:hypothetical protein
MGRYLRIRTFKDPFEQTIHVISTEWWDKCAHLINYTAQRPNVTFVIVRLVFPNFRTRIVRSTSLSIKKTLFSYFTDIKVSQLCIVILIEKDVCAFHVSMEDTQIMKSLKASYRLN